MFDHCEQWDKNFFIVIKCKWIRMQNYCSMCLRKVLVGSVELAGQCETLQLLSIWNTIRQTAPQLW